VHFLRGEVEVEQVVGTYSRSSGLSLRPILPIGGRPGTLACTERAVSLEVGLRRPVSLGAGQGERWARLVVDVPGPLRFGTWYRVLSAGSEETVVVVRNHAVIVQRRSLEIVQTRPNA